MQATQAQAPVQAQAPALAQGQAQESVQSGVMNKVSIVSNTIARVFSGYGFYIVIGIVIIILVVYLYRNLYMFEGMQNDNNNKPPTEVEIMRFSANAWCDACKQSEADWNEVMRKYNGKVIKGSKLHFVEIDCSDAEKQPGSKENELMDKYSIEHFPTYKIIKGNNVIDYNMRFNDETFSEFINKML